MSTLEMHLGWLASAKNSLMQKPVQDTEEEEVEDDLHSKKLR